MLRRSERLIDMTQYFVEHPYQNISLNFFGEKYQAAKSSISEDIAIISETFNSTGIGKLITTIGAQGGVKYIPFVAKEVANTLITPVIESLWQGDRILPGGYIYLSDILGDTKILRAIGILFATSFSELEVDAIMTVETKGIPIAYTTAMYLNVPVVIVRRDNRITEGSTVTTHYISGSSKRIQSMTLARRSLSEGARVLIIDDFMKAGGTIQGMINLADEFKAKIVGVGVFIEALSEQKIVSDYVSILKIAIDESKKRLEITKGNIF